MTSSSQSRAPQAAAFLAPVLLGALALPPQDTSDEAASRDVVSLVDGRFVDGKRLELTDDGVRVHFENGAVELPRAMVLDYVIADAPTDEPVDEEEREKLERGLVRFEGRWMRADRRARLIDMRIAEQRAEIEERQTHSRWSGRYRETTKSFEFEHTIPPHAFEGYRDAMEAYFQSFKKEWKVRAPRDDPRLKVCFYGSRKEFHRTSSASKGVLGYFRFAEPMELDIYYDHLDPALSEDVMFHEANHYLQKLIDLDFKIPHFPGESLAEYYGASEWDPETDKLVTGLVQEGRLAEIRADIASDKWMGLEELILDGEAYEHYTWGWSLVYFMMKHPEHEKKFRKFFRALPKAKDIERTKLEADEWGRTGGLTALGLVTVEPGPLWDGFKKYMKLKDDEQVREFERAWHTFIEEELPLTTPRGLAKAASKAKVKGRRKRAERLYHEAIAAGSNHPNTFHQLAQLVAEKEDWDEAFELWDQALAIDPLFAEAWAEKGKALAMSGEKKEGIRLIKLAREIGLDYEIEEIEVGRKRRPGGG